MGREFCGGGWPGRLLAVAARLPHDMGSVAEPGGEGEKTLLDATEPVHDQFDQRRRQPISAVIAATAALRHRTMVMNCSAAVRGGGGVCDMRDC